MVFLRLYKIGFEALPRGGKKKKINLFQFCVEIQVTASHMAALLLLQGSLKQGARRSGSMGIDCLEGKQEVTSLGRFNSSTASCCDRSQHFTWGQRCILTVLPHRPCHLHSPCRRLKKRILYCIEMVNFVLFALKSLHVSAPHQPSHSPEIRNRTQIPSLKFPLTSQITNNNQSHFSHLTPVSAWHLNLHSPPCCRRANSPEQWKDPAEC